MNLEGDLGDVSLANLIELMGTHRRSGGIRLKRPGQLGLVYFVDGEIVDASAGAAQGEDALYQLLAWDEATFEVRETLRAPARSIWANWKQLLLDGARRLDEGKYQDATEDDLVWLMSALEQILVKIRDKNLRRQPARVLALYGELVNRAIEFCETLPELDGHRLPLAAVLAETAPTTPAARLLEAEGNRLAKEHLEGLPGTLPKGPAELSIPAVCGALLDVLERFLDHIVQRFRSSELRQHWTQTCSLFVQELRASVELVEL